MRTYLSWDESLCGIKMPFEITEEPFEITEEPMECARIEKGDTFAIRIGSQRHDFKVTHVLFWINQKETIPQISQCVYLGRR